MRNNRTTRTRLRSGISLLAFAALASCDFEVVNPGPVRDEFLNDPEAFGAIVNGTGRDLAEGMNFIAFHGAMVTRELFPTGGTGQFGISVENADGILSPDEQGAPWDDLQRARWTAEDGLRRFAEAIPAGEFAASEVVAQAFLWAGYANRTLGENMCEAVIDGGSIQPRTVFLERAAQHFTDAIETAQAAGADTIETAARAGRASVLVHLGEWESARADAALVPEDFVFRLAYHDIGDSDQYNRIAHAAANEPYKTHTVWGTIYEDYYPASGDPRVPWEDTGLPGDGGVECCGQVPFYRQLKHPSEDADINLSSGREMRLLEAEALLTEGDWPEAMGIINELRAAVQAPSVSAADATEAWTRLKRERGIELWLEGRRLGDQRRWQEANTPGNLDLPDFEAISPVFGQNPRSLCFDIPDSERDTNPNLPPAGE